MDYAKILSGINIFYRVKSRESSVGLTVCWQIGLAIRVAFFILNCNDALKATLFDKAFQVLNISVGVRIFQGKHNVNFFHFSSLFSTLQVRMSLNTVLKPRHIFFSQARDNCAMYQFML